MTWGWGRRALQRNVRTPLTGERIRTAGWARVHPRYYRRERQELGSRQQSSPAWDLVLHLALEEHRGNISWESCHQFMLWTWLVNLLCCWEKYHKQKQLKWARIYSCSRRVESIMEGKAWEERDASWWHFHTHRKQWCKATNPQSLPPVKYFPARLCLLWFHNLLRQCRQLEIKWSNTRPCGGWFSFKPWRACSFTCKQFNPWVSVS